MGVSWRGQFGRKGDIFCRTPLVAERGGGGGRLSHFAREISWVKRGEGEERRFSLLWKNGGKKLTTTSVHEKKAFSAGVSEFPEFLRLFLSLEKIAVATLGPWIISDLLSKKKLLFTNSNPPAVSPLLGKLRMQMRLLSYWAVSYPTAYIRDGRTHTGFFSWWWFFASLSRP